MSPEQASDTLLTEPSDWYAVGVMLYEALTGRRPFEGTADEIMRRKLTEVPTSPRELRPELPADLDALCMDLLPLRPDHRPDGREILTRLDTAPSQATLDVERTTSTGHFVGRTAELHALRQAMNDARD